jgi:hypothetical protein
LHARQTSDGLYHRDASGSHGRDPDMALAAGFAVSTIADTGY